MEKSREAGAKKYSIDLVLDSGSSLYDSFEVNSFKRQLDSAISSRSFSMPHLSDSDRHAPPPPSPPAAPSKASTSKKFSKISRSLHKFIRSVFKPKSTRHANTVIQVQERAVYNNNDDRNNGLSTIPEKFSSGVEPLARRTVSERFIRPTSVGISCA